MFDAPLLTELRDKVMWITINREDRRNAMNAEVTTRIARALSLAVEGGEARAIVLTGSGDRAFCAGADLTPDSGSFRFDHSKLGSPFASLLKAAKDLPLPLVARVNGHCMAGGMGLLGMCDLAVAAETARFGMPEVKVGVFPMQIMSVLRDIIPPRKLYEMALTGEAVTAAEALEIGLINYAVPPAELDAKLAWLLGRILDKSPTAIRRGKNAMRQVDAMNFDQAIAYLEAQISILALTEDAAEGRRAFNEKRAPQWTGR